MRVRSALVGFVVAWHLAGAVCADDPGPERQQPEKPARAEKATSALMPPLMSGHSAARPE